MTKGRVRGVDRRGKKKGSRYLFNFTVEPVWQEAIIFYIFYMISLRPHPRGHIFLCRLSAVDLIFLHPGRYYCNFLGTELQFNFIVTHELQRHRKTRFIQLLYIICILFSYTAQSRFLMKIILKREHINPILMLVVAVCALAFTESEIYIIKI